MSGNGGPSSVQQRYELAQQLHRQGRYAEAERHYRDVLNSYGEYVGLLTRLAEVCFLQQHFEDAARFYRRAVAVAPRNAVAHGGLGCTLNELGRHKEALPHIEQAISLASGNPGPYLDLGNALSALDRHDEALAAFAKAAALDPACIDAHCNAGNLLAKLGRYEEAIIQFETALAQRPDHVPSLSNLGATLLLLNRPEQAIPRFKSVVRLQPDIAPAHYNLGKALQTLNMHEEAVDSFRKVVALAPDHVEAFNRLGRSLSALGRADEASSAFERSLAIDSGRADTHFEIGGSLQLFGRFAEARRAFERAIAIAPEAPSYWYPIVVGETVRESDPAIAALEGMIRRAATYSAADQSVLYFAMAKAYDDLKRYEEAFECLSKGNAIERGLSLYDEKEEVETLQRIASLFSSEYLAARAGCGDPSEVPVFIVGMPRSGTTLVEQILASHPKVYGAGEFGDLGHLFDSYAADGRIPPSGQDLPSEVFTKIGSRYVELLRRKSSEAVRITNKMPGNFASAGLISLALPKASIIHVRRDPLDTCFSCYSNLFHYGHLYTYDLGELGRYYRAYDVLMAHWRRVLPEGAMLEVCYEELVENFEPQARRIVEHCGLEWNIHCLSFHKTERPVTTASVRQVRQPLFKTSVGRWQPYARWLGPLREALGEAESRS